MQRRSLIFVVISVLVVALVYSSFTPFILFAEPYDPGWRSSQDCTITSFGGVLCCWNESGVEYCQTCVRIPYGTPGTEEGGWECTTKEKSLEQPPTPPPFGPAAPLQGGVLEQPPTPPPSDTVGPIKGGILEQLEQGDGTPGFMPGFLERQQLQPPPAEQGAAELSPPATEETQPATEEEEQPAPVCQEGLEFNEVLGFCVPTDCQEGQVLDEGTGLCVLEEPEAPEEELEEHQQQQAEEEQPSGGSGSVDSSNN